VPALVAVLGGLLFGGAGVAVLTDYRGFGRRLREKAPKRTRMGNAERYMRILGCCYLVFGILLFGIGLAMFVTLS
jgi:hypothetical protein